MHHGDGDGRLYDDEGGAKQTARAASISREPATLNASVTGSLLVTSQLSTYLCFGKEWMIWGLQHFKWFASYSLTLQRHWLGTIYRKVAWNLLAVACVRASFTQLFYRVRRSTLLKFRLPSWSYGIAWFCVCHIFGLAPFWLFFSNVLPICFTVMNLETWCKKVKILRNHLHGEPRGLIPENMLI